MISGSISSAQPRWKRQMPRLSRISSATIRSALIRPERRGGRKSWPVVHVVLAHDRHRREHAGRPVLVGHHPALAARTRCARTGRAPACPLTRASRRARRLRALPPGRARLADDGVEHAPRRDRRCASNRRRRRKPSGVKTGLAVDAELLRRQSTPSSQAVHEPRQHAADRDRVEPEHVGVVVEPSPPPAGRRCRTAGPWSGRARSPS